MYVRRAARHVKSIVLEAEAQHHQTDALTSFAALVGLLLVRYGPDSMAKADHVAALLALLVVFYTLWKLLWRAFQELMDEHPLTLI
jgi:divalent metal cation (Fe/Co/Zn/Cd) transporter